MLRRPPERTQALVAVYGAQAARRAKPTGRPSGTKHRPRCTRVGSKGRMAHPPGSQIRDSGTGLGELPIPGAGADLAVQVLASGSGDRRAPKGVGRPDGRVPELRWKNFTNEAVKSLKTKIDDFSQRSKAVNFEKTGMLSHQSRQPTETMRVSSSSRPRGNHRLPY